MLGDIPDDLLGKYDVVHIGLVVAALPAGDPAILIEKLLSLLSKPVTSS